MSESEKVTVLTRDDCGAAETKGVCILRVCRGTSGRQTATRVITDLK